MPEREARIVAAFTVALVIGAVIAYVLIGAPHPAR